VELQSFRNYRHQNNILLSVAISVRDGEPFRYPGPNLRQVTYSANKDTKLVGSRVATLMIYIREVLSSNTCRVTDSPEWDFSWFLSVPPNEYWDSAFEQYETASSPIVKHDHSLVKTNRCSWYSMSTVLLSPVPLHILWEFFNFVPVRNCFESYPIGRHFLCETNF
jgi:hypothetical protein